MFTIPCGFDSFYFEKLRNFRGVLLLEKIQTSLDLIDKLECKKYYVHLRDFDENKKLEELNCNKIIWPNLINDNMDPIINTFPNILDFICNQSKKSLIDKKTKILNFIKNDDKIYIYIEIDNKEYDIEILNTDDDNLLPVYNGFEINWPNYFKCINLLFDELLYKILDYDKSNYREHVYCNIIKKLEGD